MKTTKLVDMLLEYVVRIIQIRHYYRTNDKYLFF